jgi:kynurenine formamidase
MKIIDLSQEIYAGMEVYPGDPKVEIKSVHSLGEEGWRLSLLKMGSHAGTHVDAFSHMDEAGETIDKIPLERFFGKARAVRPEEEFPKEIGLIFSKGKPGMSLLDKIIEAAP